MTDLLSNDWKFVPSLASKDFVPYFKEKLLVGMELELTRRTKDANLPWKELFGVGDNGMRCEKCGRPDCWEESHIAPTMIRDIHCDGGDREFRIAGTNISSEEFIKRLPIEAFQKYFIPTLMDGLHTHAIIPHNRAVIPRIIPQNIYQFFRAYYSGWAYLFGNQKKSLLRSSWARFENIHADGLALFLKPLVGRDWLTKRKCNDATATSRSGIHFNESGFHNSYVGSSSGVYDYNITGRFDMEIRVADSTIDVDQLVALRALTKAIVLKGAQLSMRGGISLPEELLRQSIEMHELIQTKIAHRSNDEEYPPIAGKDLKVLRQNAVDLSNELSPFITPFEAKSLQTILDKPVRDREVDSEFAAFQKKLNEENDDEDLDLDSDNDYDNDNNDRNEN